MNDLLHLAQRMMLRAHAPYSKFHVGAALPPSTDLMPLALASRGCTGADVEAFVRRAKGTARRADQILHWQDDQVVLDPPTACQIVIRRKDTKMSRDYP